MENAIGRFSMEVQFDENYISPESFAATASTLSDNQYPFFHISSNKGITSIVINHSPP
jgi:hypothetical protein